MRGANSVAGTLTPLETGIAADVDLINAAHTDPAVRALMLSSTRGEDDHRRSAAEAEAEAAGDAGWRRQGPMERGAPAPKLHHWSISTTRGLGSRSSQSR